MSDDELVEFASEFRAGIVGDRIPMLMCFAVSGPLSSLLRLYGVENELVESDLGEMNHFWIRLPDGRALDPTADQFDAFGFKLNVPKVYLGEPLSIHV